MPLPYAILTPLFVDGMRHRNKPYDLPPHWTIGSGAFTTSNERYLETTVVGELLYNGTALNQLRINDTTDANYRIVFDVYGLTGFDVEIRGRRSADDTFVGLRARSVTNEIALFEYDGGSIVGTTTVTHTLNNNEFYRLELWNFQNSYYGIVNGQEFVNRTASGSIDSAEDSFSIYVRANTDGTFARIYFAEINELVDPVSPMLNNNNLYVQLRELVQTEIETINPNDFEDFKRVFNIYSKNKNVGYSNAGWWRFGYPLREPPTEGTF